MGEAASGDRRRNIMAEFFDPKTRITTIVRGTSAVAAFAVANPQMIRARHGRRLLGVLRSSDQLGAPGYETVSNGRADAIVARHGGELVLIDAGDAFSFAEWAELGEVL
jgi:hypothetical protein